MPELYIITGSNGAGKSTVGFTYLPENIRNNYTVFDGDKLFAQKRKELYPNPIPVFKEAGRIAGEWLNEHFIESVNDALSMKDHFVYEGHFRDDSSWEIPKKFKKQSYSINLIFLGLSDQGLSESRVIKRTEFGGHYVPPAEIDLNFRGNLIMLDKYFDIIHDLKIIDSSESEHLPLLYLLNGKVKDSVSVDDLPQWFKAFLPSLTELFPKQKQEKK